MGADAIKRYLGSCGCIRCSKKICVPDEAISEITDWLMPAFLFTNPNGCLLFGAGSASPALKTPAG